MYTGSTTPIHNSQSGSLLMELHLNHRLIHEKLAGASDILIVSGDLVSLEAVGSLADLHRANNAALTLLLNRPAFHLNNLQVQAKH